MKFKTFWAYFCIAGTAILGIDFLVKLYQIVDMPSFICVVVISILYFIIATWFFLKLKDEKIW